MKELRLSEGNKQTLLWRQRADAQPTNKKQQKIKKKKKKINQKRDTASLIEPCCWEMIWRIVVEMWDGVIGDQMSERAADAANKTKKKQYAKVNGQSREENQKKKNLKFKFNKNSKK